MSCNYTYKKIPGNSYQSTYNKLVAGKILDKYLNVKTDVATWRKERSELNELASAKLRQKVNLFDERKLLNGIQAVPNMKLFGMLDYIHKNNITDYQPQIVRDEIGIDEFGDSNTNSLEAVPSVPIESRIYKSLGLSNGSVIENTEEAQKQIDHFNSLNTGKVLSLVKVFGGHLIKSEYKANYLYENTASSSSLPELERIDTNSNNNFNLSCIK